MGVLERFLKKSQKVMVKFCRLLLVFFFLKRKDKLIFFYFFFYSFTVFFNMCCVSHGSWHFRVCFIRLRPYRCVFFFLTVFIIFFSNLLLDNNHYVYACILRGHLLVFSLIDLFYFFIFYEIVLIPIFYLIFLEGSYTSKFTSSFFLVIFTIFGGLPFLLWYTFYGLIELGSGFDFIFWRGIECFWVFIIFMFLVKIPLFGVHTWLPKAHVDASAPGSIVLAGILLKLGCYRFIVFCYSLPYSCIGFLSFAALFRFLISSIICNLVVDLKVAVAYSSVSHINLALVGVLFYFYQPLIRAVAVFVGHGFTSPGIFLVVFLRTLLSLRNFKSILYVSRFLNFFFLFFFIQNIRFPYFINFLRELNLFSIIVYINNFFFLFTLFSRFFFIGIFSFKFLTYLKVRRKVMLLNFKNTTLSIFFLLRYLLVSIFFIFF